MKHSNHSWNFLRAGGVDQVVLAGADDLLELKNLNQKLWVALACPTVGTELDDATMRMIDEDGDGRIRAPEVLEAIAWSSKVFGDLGLFFKEGDSVPLSAFSTSSDEGKAALASAKRMLIETKQKDAKEIGLPTVLDVVKAFTETRFNGDGIVPAEAAEDEAGQKAIEDMISACGSVEDRSGKPGLDEKLVATFFDASEKAIAWWEKGQSDEVATLAAATGAAFDAFAKVRAKIDDYFARCRLVAFDSRAAAALNAQEAELLALAPKSLDATHEDVMKLPLSRVEANKALGLESGLNPAWVDVIKAFSEQTVKPALGGAKAALSESDWGVIKTKLSAYGGWQGEKPEGKTVDLGLERLKELSLDAQKEALLALIAQDLELKEDFEQIASVERALRYRRDLLLLLQNFVNFSQFYSKKQATFLAGKLFLDARSCDLVVYVNNPAKHASLAGLSSAYLAYCDITRPSGEKRAIVAAFTNGDTDNLMVGRNGLFYDRDGKDWDATITSIVENPISVRQAFWSPYKRLVRMVEEQVAKRAAEKEKAANAGLDKTATAAGSADTKALAPPAEPPKKMDVGTVAAIGVAVAGVGAFLTAILSMFTGLGVWLPVGIGLLLLAISGPSMLIAWLKLRRRNLGPILDSNGWAVNAMARINVPFGSSLTQLSELPEGASRSLDDPYAEKKTPWLLYFILLLILGLGVAWLVGKLDGYLPESVQSKTVLSSKAAPSAAPAAPAASAVPAVPAVPAGTAPPVAPAAPASAAP